MFDFSSYLPRVSPKIDGELMLLPAPKLDWEERLCRRMSFRNERNLYHRNCSLSSERCVSFHREENGYQVIEQSQWWADDWDALEYGRAFDFSKTFFEQFAELQRAVPKMSMIINRCENSDYGPYSVDSKNCYMSMSCIASEDMYHCFHAHQSKDCADCLVCNHCELCYECIDCLNLFDSQFCQNCENSSGLLYCSDLQGCSDCIACKNLVRKSNYILNKPASAEQIASLKEKLKSHTYRSEFAKKVQAAFVKQAHRATRLINCENVCGDYLINCKNSYHCFYCSHLEDCAYAVFCPQNNKDCVDIIYTPQSELIYECISPVGSYHSAFLSHAWENKFSYYLMECFYSEHLFACIGLKKEQYCILNKKYSEKDYFSLLKKIIAHMKETGEWGEFFPTSLSPYAYNETIANDFFPLDEDQAKSKGYRWKPLESANYQAATFEVPDKSEEVSKEVCSELLACRNTGKNFKIIPAEFKLYKKLDVPLPILCPDERYRRRFSLRNKPKLYQRTCAISKKQIETSFSPKRQEMVVSEKEFLNLLY